LEGGAEHEATVLWTDASLDVALLQADRTEVGADVGPARWGMLACDHPDYRPVCTTIGFPQALHRKVPGGPRHAAQAQSLDGRIAPRGRSGRTHSGMYVFELDDPDAASFDVWQGMSGAAVFCDDVIVGLATNAADYWRGETLLVLPAARLLGAAGFADAVAAATGARPRLGPADLGPLLVEQPDPHLAPSYLLDPVARIVPMAGNASTAHALRAWCLTGRRIDVAAVTGADGTGKTRLALELLVELGREGRARTTWTGGLLARTPREVEPGYALFATVRQPLLLIVDGADARLDQVHALLDIFDGRLYGPPVRILLIVRGREDWWSRLRATWRGSTVMGRGETFRVTPGDALAGGGAEALYARAARAFADHVRLLRGAGIQDGRPEPDLERPYRYPIPAGLGGSDEDGTVGGLTVGALHMAALADVLSRTGPEPALGNRPLDVLLSREEEHLRRIAGSRMPSGLVDTGLLRTLAAVQQTAGARTVDDAFAAVRAGFEVHHRGRADIAQPQGPVLGAYEEILTAAYPSGDGTHWGAIGPEALGAALVAEVEAASGGTFVADLLHSRHLSAAQRHRALTVLVRTTEFQPELVAAAAESVALAPELLLPIAVEWLPGDFAPDRAMDWLLACRDAIARQDGWPVAPETRLWALRTVDAALRRLDSTYAPDPAREHFVPADAEPLFVPRRGTAEPPPRQRARAGTGPSRPGHASRTAPAPDDRPAHRHRADRRAHREPDRPDHRAGHGHHRVSRTTPQPGPTRALLAVLALAYLALLAYTACETFYFDGPFADTRVAWILPPVVLAVGIEAALQSRHWPGSPEFTDLPPELLAIAVATTSGTMYADHQYPHTNLALLAAAATTTAAIGQYLLVTATRHCLGQITYA
jgi:hypothetical protein